MPHQAPRAVADSNAAEDESGQLGGLLAAAMSPGKSDVERSLEAREDEYQPSNVRNRIVPALLLSIGVTASYAVWWAMSATALGAIMGATVNLLVQTVIYVPLGFAAALLVVTLFGVEFDAFKLTLFKLAAVCLGVLALMDGVYLAMIVHYFDFDFRCMLIGFVVQLAAAALPIWYLFELDFHETILMALILTLPRVLLLFLLANTINQLWLR